MGKKAKELRKRRREQLRQNGAGVVVVAPAPLMIPEVPAVRVPQCPVSPNHTVALMVPGGKLYRCEECMDFVLERWGKSMLFNKRMKEIDKILGVA